LRTFRQIFETKIDLNGEAEVHKNPGPHILKKWGGVRFLHHPETGDVYAFDPREYLHSGIAHLMRQHQAVDLPHNDNAHSYHVYHAVTSRGPEDHFRVFNSSNTKAVHKDFTKLHAENKNVQRMFKGHKFKTTHGDQSWNFD
jgi:hypothetical protein